MTIDMSQFFQVFFDETGELLAEMEKLLLAVDVSSPDPEVLNAIFRAAHSIKGSASTFGITDIADVTHVLESLLDLIRKGEMALTSEYVDAFLLAKDILKMLLDGHRFNAPVDLEAVADARMLLQSLSQGKVSAISARASVPEEHAISVLEKIDERTHCFRFELPELSAWDIQVLSKELGLLGWLSKDDSEDKCPVFTLITNEKLEDVVAIFSFIINPDTLKITEISLPAMSVEEMESARIQQEEARGYGFFEPVEALREMVETKTKQEDAQGYGFFQPVETLQAMSKIRQEIVQGYGFFEPLEISEPIQTDEDKKSTNTSPSTSMPPGKRGMGKQALTQESSSIRVGIEKVDQLINLVGELVITQAMIEQRSDTLDPLMHERLLSSVSQLTRNTRDLQEVVMSIRMMPMDYVFSRFPRMVRDLAAKLGKKVDFITIGSSTELDKSLVERIIDPLTHLVRNSIDHGIEAPAVRVEAGKSATGKLSLSAEHRGGNIIIKVSDDGSGLNREKILEKAKLKGLPASDAMSDAEVWQLIFSPGFSTAEVVTDVSGRGVGMDIVKRNITAMSGVIDIFSYKGLGTTISISLPLTLAILEGMSIRVGDEVYILPLAYVIESLQPKASEVKEIAGQGKVVKVRGDYLPLIALYEVFDVKPRFTDPSEGIVVILESDGKKIGLFIDDLVGQQQVVVKNIESNYKKIRGVSGATILGDGGVSLIIDVAVLVRSRAGENESVL